MTDLKKGIGTIEGVALILSILACLTLFLKILPNINQNAEFYNEQFLTLQKQLDTAQIQLHNLEVHLGKPSVNESLKGLNRAATELHFTKDNLPPEVKSRIEDIQGQLNTIIEQLQGQ